MFIYKACLGKIWMCPADKQQCGGLSESYFIMKAETGKNTVMGTSATY